MRSVIINVPRAIGEEVVSNWGEPERAPHISVVDIGDTSVACPTI